MKASRFLAFFDSLTNRTRWFSLLSALLLTMGPLQADPNPTSFTFTGTGNWSSSANWQDGFVPPSSLPSGNTITIDGTGACTLDVTQTLASGSSMTVNAGKMLNLGLPGGVNLTVNAGATLTVAAAGTLLQGRIVNSGTMDIYGSYTAFYMTDNSGAALNIKPGGSYSCPSCAETMSAGSVINNEGTLHTGTPSTWQGSVNNLATGVITDGGNGSQLTFGANSVVNNYGSLISRTASSAGLFTNHATGTLSMPSTCSFTLQNGGTFANYGTITLGNANNVFNLNPGGTLLNHATIKGVGTLVQNGTLASSATGVLAPGLSPGKFTVTGDLDLGSGTFSCEINGTAQGTSHDWLAVSGAATLTGGSLVVNWGAFTPTAGQNFTVMTFGSRVGTFANVTIPTVPGLVLTPSYTSTALTITAAQPNTAPTVATDAGSKLFLGRPAGASSSVARVNTDGTGLALNTISSTVSVYGVAVDSVHGKVYFTSHTGDRLSRANLDGTGLEASFITVAAGGGATGMAIDVANGYLYWAQAYLPNGGGIMRANLDGSGVTQILSGVNVYDLALNVPANKIYYAGDFSFSIGRCDLNGANNNRTWLANVGGVSGTVNGMSGLAVDLTNGKLYWNRSNGIGQANLDGSSIVNPFITLTGGSTDLVADPVNGKLFWTHGGGAVGSANLNGTSVNESFVTGLTGVWGIDLGSADFEGTLATRTGTYSDPDGNTVTLSVTGGPGSVTKTGTSSGTWTWTYTSPDGPATHNVTITANDGTTTSATSFAVTVLNVAPTIALTGDSTVNAGAAYTLNLGAITDPGTDTVTAFSINWGDGNTENFTGSPASTSKTHAYSTGGSRTITVSLTDEDGTFTAGTKAITVNAAPTLAANTGTKLFIGQSVNNAIARANTDGTGLINGFIASPGRTVVSVAVDETRGKIYFTDGATPGHIARANLDGTGLEPDFITGPTVNAPAAIGVDAATGQICWGQANTSDAATRGVWRANADGSGLTQLVQLPFGSYDCAVADGKVYYVPYNQGQALSRINLDGTGNVPAFVPGYCYAPTVDLLHQKIYFIHYTGSYKLGRVNLDGTNPQYNLASFSGSPAGIALDAVGGYLYYTTYYSTSIGRVGLDGSGLNDSFITGLTGAGGGHAAYGIALGSADFEGTQASRTGTYSDPDGNTVTLSVTGGPGSVTKTGTSSGTWTWTYTPPDGPATHTVTLTATDSAGATSTTTFSIAALNVAPTLTLTGNSTANAGAAYTLNLGAITDPGTDTVTAYSINWGDGNTENFTGSPVGVAKTHSYAAVASRTITVYLTDEDGTHTAGAKAVSVINTPPTVAADAGSKLFIARYGNQNRIARANVDGSGFNADYLTVTGNSIGVAVDTVGGKIFWTQFSAGKIGRANLDGSGVNSDFITGLSNPIGMAVDSVNSRLYWADSGSGTIKRANLDGTAVTTIVSGFVGSIQDVALDVPNNKLYYIRFSSADIGRADLDGANNNPAYIVTTASGFGIYGIGLDLVNSKIYWAAFSTQKIGRANLNGSGIENAFLSLSTGPDDVVIDPQGGKLYWTTQTGSVGRANLDGTGLNQSFLTGVGLAWGIALGDQDNEGAQVTRTGTYSDADGNTVAITANLGSISKTGTSSGTWTWTYTPADGPATANVTITADDGSTTSTTTFSVSVSNVAPTIALTGSSSANQGAAYTLNLGAITDPGTDTVSAFSINWGDGNTENFTGNPAGTSKTHTYATTGAKTITVSLTDEDGTFTGGTKAITVDNSSPVAGADSLNRPNTTRVVKVLKTALLANDSDANSDPLTITAVGGALPIGSTVVISGNFVVYTAPATNSGNGSFTYTLSDGTAGPTVTGTVNISETGSSTGNGQPNALAITPSGDDFIVTFLGVPGGSFRVQYTTSATPPYVWNEFSPQAIYTAAPNGVFSHTDVNPPGPMRLYRAVSNP